MARERMVTRTINEYQINALCVDTLKAELSEQSVKLTGEYKDETEILETLQKRYNLDTFKVVSVKSVTIVEKLYGMSELDFIKYAKELPPRTKQQ